MYAFRYLILPAVVLLCAVSVSAEDFVLGQMYGSGVHVYFSATNTRDVAQAQQHYLKAHEYLTSAIKGGTNDPRAYYFRGLAYMKLGRPAEAELDFKKGAKLESGDLNRLYNVARSLRRIQGHERLALENHRVKARMAALKEAERLRQVRYEQIRAEEARVVEAQAAEAPEVPADATAPPADADPFGVGPEDQTPSEPAVEEPAAKASGIEQPGRVLGAMGRAIGKAVGGEDQGSAQPAAAVNIPVPPQEAAPDDVDPFSEVAPVPPGKKPAPAKEAAPADDDPFPGGAPAAPAKEAAPAKKAAPADDDPFAKSGSTAPAKKTAPPNKPAPVKKKTGPADDDPFATEESAAPAPKQPKKTADLDDPFGE